MIFSWDRFRKNQKEKVPTREAIIRKSFKQYVAGNSAFDCRSRAEMEDAYETFRSAWLLSEMFLEGR